jgi:hypothetical protein
MAAANQHGEQSEADAGVHDRPHLSTESWPM